MSEQQPNPYRKAKREPGSPGYANTAAVAMVVVGWFALALGGFVAYQGWQSAQATASLSAALGSGLEPDYFQMYLGLGIAAAGAVLLVIRWTIAASRK